VVLGGNHSLTSADPADGFRGGQWQFFRLSNILFFDNDLQNLT
jgi:hypothetical protein